MEAVVTTKKKLRTAVITVRYVVDNVETVYGLSLFPKDWSERSESIEEIVVTSEHEVDDVYDQLSARHNVLVDKQIHFVSMCLLGSEAAYRPGTRLDIKKWLRDESIGIYPEVINWPHWRLIDVSGLDWSRKEELGQQGESSEKMRLHIVPITQWASLYIGADFSPEKFNVTKTGLNVSLVYQGGVWIPCYRVLPDKVEVDDEWTKKVLAELDWQVGLSQQQKRPIHQYIGVN